MIVCGYGAFAIVPLLCFSVEGENLLDCTSLTDKHFMDFCI